VTDRLEGLNATRERIRAALSAEGMPVDVTVPDGAF
jgi:hypothetical protein